MAKRGRKSFAEIQQETVEYKSITCTHCKQKIENTDGHPEYKLVNLWSNCGGVRWPIAVRVHSNCYKEFIENNSKNLYGSTKLELLKD